MLKRICIVISIPILMVSIFLEVVILSLRWIITGKRFPDAPLFLCVLVEGVNGIKGYIEQLKEQ